MIRGLSTLRRLAGQVLPARLRPRPTGLVQDLFEQATYKLECEEYQDAEILFRKCIAMDGRHAAALNDLGLTLGRLDRPEEALEFYRRAVAADPRMASSQRNMGVVLEDLGRLDEAEEAFRKAIKINPHYANAHGNLGSLLESQHRATEALDAYRRCAQLDDGNASAWFNYAHMLQVTDDFDGAVANYKKAVAALVRLVGHFPRKDFRTESEMGFDRDRAAEALADVKKVFDRLEVPFFLAFGTALGAVREGALLSHDQDLDVGFWHGADVNAVARAFREAGFTLTAHNMTDNLLDEGVSRVPLCHANGIFVDVYPHLREDDGRVWCCLGEGARRVAWENTDFGLVEVDIPGGRYHVPDPPERYLEENFGPGWREKDLYFEGTVNAPNLVGGFTPIHRSYAYYFLVRRLLHREWEGARYLFDFLRGKYPDDPDLRAVAPAFDESPVRVEHARTSESAGRYAG